MKVKKIPLERYREIFTEQEWLPAELVGNYLPNWATSIPQETLYRVYASGTFNFDDAEFYSSHTIPSGHLIGGMDIYRHAPDDPDPITLNKDWYAIVSVEGEDGMLLVDGPFKDDEHWLTELPERVKGAKIWGVPKKPDD